MVQLREGDFVKFQLQPRIASNGEQPMFRAADGLLERPQVLIMCMNAAQVKALMGERAGNKQAAQNAHAH